MDRGSHSSGSGADSSSTTLSASSGNNNGGSDTILKNLSKISHKISKPVRRPPVYENQSLLSSQIVNDVQQPPVYNINKSDFRDVVQKLTGSPAHERMATPPPIHQPKPPSSRLQRIRPPPLAQIGNRPPQLMNVVGGPPLQPLPTNQMLGGGGFIGDQRHVQAQPPSPLPPFPAVHGAAESPISAYMRFLRGSISGAAIDSDPKRFSTALSPLAPLDSPRWTGPAPAQPQPPLPPPQLQNIPPQPSSAPPIPPFPALPSSPLPFGCLPSPRSSYPLHSPGLLLSPSSQLGFQQLPLSPTVPVPSPTWKGI
ncbi:PREDICTED: VQ motif-containing protein 9-like isoform X2 [Ipomoea nil]|uniref:VQ motif-containing protein 9-like isoform X2 n=1 Tax=Ipomoea nil TaxID=35883 RepID=UPI0009008569|nr:PREDICTED: VQ motif-containing protein 9-like isoform X2 [Ipomoea nil]